MSVSIFQQNMMADISTKYVTKEDGQMLADGETWPIIATYDRGRGAILSIGDTAAILPEHDWSPEFCALIATLEAQGFDYVRFDADGGEIDSGEYPTFDW